MTDLLDLLAEQERAADPRAELVHYCLPSMGYVCGGTILGLADGGPGGHQSLGGYGHPETWAAITCPDCRAPGRREVGRIQHHQQMPVGHVCSPDDDRCRWLTIPEEDR